MNADVYRACFRELEKQAGVGTRAATWAAEHGAAVGGAVKRFAGDVGEAAVGAVRPSAWKAGIDAGVAEGRKGVGSALMMGATVPLTALDVAHTMKTKVDPSTGRQIGLGERSAVAAGRIGASVAGMRYMNLGRGAGAIARGVGVLMGGGMLTDAVTSRAGRAVDNVAAPRPITTDPSAGVARRQGPYHPAAVAGGAPVARGVT
jgi:hypothetical protein